MTTSGHLMFLALLIPTFVLLVAAAISLSHPEPEVIAAPVTLAAPGPVDSCRCEATY